MDRIFIRIANNPRSSYYAVILFIIVSIFFSLIYQMFLPLLDEGSSALRYNAHELFGAETTSFLDSLYFSIITQTTVGYGDIVPVSFSGKVCSMIQCTFGYLYLGFLIFLFITKAILKSKRFQTF